ncbi:MAG: GTP-binding protein [Euryarchaeota archaeon]|nr:GTP-binding protein [Euryarchaeota archaeon]
MIVCQLAGFLGSGKTTLLIRLGTFLGNAGRRVAIIVNEIGEIGVDGAVIESDGMKSIELTEGCICCTLSGSLQNTLRQIAREFAPDIIMIEPTGLALPTKIKQIVRTSMIGEDRTFTICLIDAFRARKLFDEAGTFLTRQMEGSDIIVVNKVDLVSHDDKEYVKNLVRYISPSTPLVFISARDGQGIDEVVSLLEEAL